jgi:hypothetical protein
LKIVCGPTWEKGKSSAKWGNNCLKRGLSLVSPDKKYERKNVWKKNIFGVNHLKIVPFMG